MPAARLSRLQRAARADALASIRLDPVLSSRKRPKLIPGRQLPAEARRDVKMLINLMAAADPSPFALEGVAVALFRSRQCLAGWRFEFADLMARSIVAESLKRVGARRPSWDEGQLWYARHFVYRWVVLAEERQPFCATCGARISDAKNSGSRRWCSEKCRYIGQGEEQGGAFKCGCCGAKFRRRWAPGSQPKPKYCSKGCQMKHRHAEQKGELRQLIAAAPPEESSAALARRLGCSRTTVSAWRHKEAAD